MPRILLVRVSILLGNDSVEFFQIDLTSTYDAIVGGKLMLVFKCYILIPEEYHASLCTVLTGCYIYQDRRVDSEPTSATKSANSSFCASVKVLNWIPFNSVPIYGVSSSIAEACASRDVFLGSAKNARSRAGVNSTSAGCGGLYASTAGESEFATMVTIFACKFMIATRQAFAKFCSKGSTTKSTSYIKMKIC